MSPNLRAVLRRGIRIGDILYSVRLDSAEINRVASEDRQDLDAIIRYQTCEIIVREDFAPSYLRECLWHEAKHGVLQNAGHLNDEDRKTDDGIFKRQESGELALLRDNPHLVALFMEADVPVSKG